MTRGQHGGGWHSKDNPWLGRSAPSSEKRRKGKVIRINKSRDPVSAEVKSPANLHTPGKTLKKGGQSETGDPEMDQLLVLLRGSAPLPADLNYVRLVQPISPGEEMTTLLHVAAGRGLLGKIPEKLLTPETMRKRDQNGRTPLHRAVSRKKLGQVPPFWMTKSNLLARDNSGRSVIDFALEKGLLDFIPEELRDCSPSYRDRALEEAIQEECFDSPLFHDWEALSASTESEKSGGSWFHILARQGHLPSLPGEIISKDCLTLLDMEGKTPLHVALESHGIYYVPEFWITPENLGIQDGAGRSGFHILAAYENLGHVSLGLFTRSALKIKTIEGASVADVLEDHGNTGLLPSELQWFSGARVRQHLRELLESDYPSALSFAADIDPEVLSTSELAATRYHFVQQWSQENLGIQLDQEQADCVANQGPHLKVTARAGSGKTRSLVTRVLFQIQHCGADPNSILVLAFNREAVAEIITRLEEHLASDQLPHVLTFHSLAYRIVRPSEELIFDEGETKEGQVLGTTIQRIIDKSFRSGPHEPKLRELMEARWNSDLERIIRLGFNLPEEEFLKHRANLPLATMSGRRVGAEEHRHIGNALIRLNLRYSYQRCIHRAAGTEYAPEFSHYHKTTDKRFVFEILGKNRPKPNAARQAFWNSDRSGNAHLIELDPHDCLDSRKVLERIIEQFDSQGITVSPMSDDDLWLLLRDDMIRNFTKAVQNFISRCQKELISPDHLRRMIPESTPELWTREFVAGVWQSEVNPEGLKVRFWQLCRDIYQRYLQVLTESQQTDFDQLMLDAKNLIREGQTSFNSAGGRGDLREIRHLLIDEYQDFSHLFDELRKSIIGQNPDIRIFCVGDDWQAINKFMGSDLRYFTGFTKDFEGAVSKSISRNYRSNQKIVEIGNQVMKGHGEPSVPKSKEQGNTWHASVGTLMSLSEAEEIVLEELGDESVHILRIASDCTSRGENLAVLSRTGSMATPEGMLKLERFQEKLRNFLPKKQRKLLEVSTTHSFKGREADVVVLVDPEAYPLIHPDSIFNTIFDETLASLIDDERRLFYVGVTRPKKTLYLLSCPRRYSERQSFRIRFLEGHYPKNFDINTLQSNLVLDDRVILRLTNLPGAGENGGTYPIKEHLKASRYKWSQDQKSWSTFLLRGSINSPLECTQFLETQPWMANADGILATFFWEEQKYQVEIRKDQFPPNRERGSLTDRAHSPEEQVSFLTENLSNPKPPPSQQVRSNPSTQDSVLESASIFRTNVVGMRYGGAMQKARHLSTGDFLRLEREPSNKFDRNAIKVVTPEGAKIGYLSKHVSRHMAKALDDWGGLHQAKVSSIRKQEPPHFLVSITLSFPIPPGVKIPPEHSSSAQTDDNPFASNPTKSDTPKPKDPSRNDARNRPQVPHEESKPPALSRPSPESGASDQGHRLSLSGLSQSQRSELEGLIEPKLASLIAKIYLAGLSDWPELGYEELDSHGYCTGSMLEVAWTDFKIGIASSENDYTAFKRSGWLVIQSADVSEARLHNLFARRSNSISLDENRSGSAD